MYSSHSFSEKISIYSFILSILVVLIHANTAAEYDAASGLAAIQNYVSCNLSLCAVPAFFMILGFFFARAANCAAALKKRIYSVLIPYLLWNLIYTAYLFLVNKYVISLNAIGDSFSPSLFFSGVLLGRYNLVAWFLFEMIIYSLLTPLIVSAFRRRGLGIFFLAALLALTLCADPIPIIKLRFFFFYCLGYYLGKHAVALVEDTRKSKLKAWGCIAAFALSQIIYFYHVNDTNYFFVLYRLLLVGATYYALDFVRIGIRPFMGFTFFIFLGHSLVLESLQKIYFRSLPIPPRSGLRIILFAPY